MPDRAESQAPLLFMLGASLMMAHQVAGKAVRDGLFLSRFSPADLPRVIALAAFLSVLMGLGFSRILARYGPLRLVPAAFGVGALLHLVEFACLQVAGEAVVSVVVTVVYLHLVGFGAILLSGFWSVANEVFDPRRAKSEFGRIAGAGTAGGIFGGLLAERGAALFGADSLLLLLAALHLVTCVVLSRASANHDYAGDRPDDSEPWQAAREAFRQAPFLINLAVLVLLGTVAATMLDYLFKSGAAAAYGKGPQLTRYFALFYTGSQVMTFLFQSFLTPAALRKLGLGRTMQTHSAAVALGAGASLFLPPGIMAPVARALELILRGSFLRSSYELFFTPVPPREKRATKTFIDVSCDRMGDAVGAGVLQVLLLLGPGKAVVPILIVTVLISAASFWLTRRMDVAYSRVLEHGLLSRAVALNESEVQDSTTLAALFNSTALLPKQRVPGRTPTTVPAAPAPAVQDALLSRLADLRSGSARRIQAALAADQPYDPVIVPQALRLLAWAESFDSARAFLLRHAYRAVGQLVDALLDQEQDFAVRRRIPHILAYTSSQRAVDGLIAALGDTRFEIRFHCSRALEFLHRMNEDLHFDHGTLLAAVQRELTASKSIWESRRLLDNRDPGDSQYSYLDEVLRDRADKSLEHVFSLLAIQLPAEPLKVAFRALHGDDRMLRGLALEFLESHLSPTLVGMLRRLVGPAQEPQTRSPQLTLTQLMASQQSIMANLKTASAGAPSPGA